jgi:hypothetical protein
MCAHATHVLTIKRPLASFYLYKLPSVLYNEAIDTAISEFNPDTNFDRFWDPVLPMWEMTEP